MRFTSLILFVAAISLLAHAQDTIPGIDQLQGEWVVVRVESGGKGIDVPATPDAICTLKGDQLIPAKDVNDPATLKVQTDKSPAWVDLTDRDKKVMLGIYRVKDDQWEISIAEPGAERPTEFTTKEGSKTQLITMKRKAK